MGRESRPSRDQLPAFGTASLKRKKSVAFQWDDFPTHERHEAESTQVGTSGVTMAKDDVSLCPIKAFNGSAHGGGIKLESAFCLWELVLSPHEESSSIST